MSIKRLLPGRWARILGWAFAGVTWGTTAVAVAAGAGGTDAPATTLPAPIEPAVVPAPEAATTATIPDQPAAGLVVIRFTPAPKPEAQIITRTVTVASPGGGGSVSAPPAQQPAAPVVVTSSGS